MGFLNWLRSFIAGKRRTMPPPTEAEMQAACDRLVQMVKPAIFGEIGGQTPSPDHPPTSRWGGQFWGVPGEAIPVCQGTGRPMRPLVQIRTDELPDAPAFLDGIALFSIWIDVKAVFGDYDTSGTSFAIRTYASFDGLAPIGPTPPVSKDRPAFPILWRGPISDQPVWDDIALEIPDSVTQSNKEVWFFDSKYAVQAEALYETCPVKLGGWPNWIQNSRWPNEAEFCLQINSTDKGKLNIGDAGSIYLFRTPRGWVSRSDCY